MDVDGLGLGLTLREHDGEGQQLLSATYAEAQQFLKAQAQAQPQCVQVGDANAEASQACLLFVARALVSSEQEAEARRLWPLSKIVAACGTNLYDFFRELPVKAAMLEPFLEARGVQWQRLEANHHIKEWQKTLISLTLLSKKFKDLVPRFIPNSTIPRQTVLRVGWFLFVNLKAKLLPPFPDLVSCVTLLTCVVNVLVAHAPKLPDGMLAQQQAGQTVDTLQAICADIKMDLASVSHQMAAADSLLCHMLPSWVAEWRSSDRAHPDASQLQTRCAFFAGLLTDPARLKLCIEGLDREYSTLYNRRGELDERDFLLQDFSSMASPRLSPGSLYNAAKRVHMAGPSAGPSGASPPRAVGPASGSPRLGMPLGPGAFIAAPSGCPTQPQQQGMRPNGSTAPGLQSPLPILRLGASGPACTPVTEAMAAATWLRAAISGAQTEPSPALTPYLEAAGGPDLSAAVSKRAWELAEAALPDERPQNASAASLMGFPHVQSSLNALRRTEAVKLYLLALEAVVLGERVNGEEAMRMLLSAVKFHKGLMACCLEVVIASFKMVSCNFPHVLDRLKLKAFDLSKVIQPFVKYMPSLPRELKRHLFNIEERILDSLAWEPGSPLYNLIIQAAGGPGNAQGQGSGAGSRPCELHAASAAVNSGDTPAAAPSASASACARPASGRDDPMDLGGASSPPCPVRVSTSTAPSPKRPHSGLQALSSPSPLKKARSNAGSACAESGAIPTLLFAEPVPLPLAVGKPLGPSASGVLIEFLQKVHKLMQFRLALMVDSFDFAPLDGLSVFTSIMEVLDHALYHCTHLLYNRHLDQLVLSALYGYCKVHKLNKVSFKEIIAHYKRQPQATQAVFRSVNLEQSNPGLVPKGQADIIAFYNQCFVPVMKPFLLRTVQAAGTVGCGGGGDMAGVASTTVAQLQSVASHPAPLGLPPIPPNPKQAQHIRARRMSSSAVPCVPAGSSAGILQQQVLAAGNGLPRPVPAPSGQPSGSIHSFFPKLHLPGPNGSPGQVLNAAATSSAQPSALMVGSAPTMGSAEALISTGLMRAGFGGSAGGAGTIRCPKPVPSIGDSGSAASRTEHQPGAVVAAAVGAAGLAGVAPAGRPVRKLPSGLAALLHALDSAEASANSDVPQGSSASEGGGCESSSFVSPMFGGEQGRANALTVQAAGAGGNGVLAPAASAPRCSTAVEAQDMEALPSRAASPSSNDSSSPSASGPAAASVPAVGPVVFTPRGGATVAGEMEAPEAICSQQSVRRC